LSHAPGNLTERLLHRPRTGQSIDERRMCRIIDALLKDGHEFSEITGE
jgi:hypothetical protein